MKKLFRQGDVLLVVDTAAAVSQEKSEATAPAVIAEGEHSGHLHRLHAKFGGVAMFRDDAMARSFGDQHIGSIKGFGGGEIRHEFSDGTPTGDHNTLEIPAGDVHAIQQREYDPKGERMVYD